MKPWYQSKFLCISWLSSKVSVDLQNKNLNLQFQSITGLQKHTSDMVVQNHNKFFPLLNLKCVVHKYIYYKLFLTTTTFLFFSNGPLHIISEEKLTTSRETTKTIYMFIYDSYNYS